MQAKGNDAFFEKTGIDSDVFTHMLLTTKVNESEEYKALVAQT